MVFKITVGSEYLTVHGSMVEHSSFLFMYVMNICICIMGTKCFVAMFSRTAGNRTNLAVSHAALKYYPRRVQCFRKEKFSHRLTARSVFNKGHLVAVPRFVCNRIVFFFCVAF
jgi:hypothetical protein